MKLAAIMFLVAIIVHGSLYLWAPDVLRYPRRRWLRWKLAREARAFLRAESKTRHPSARRKDAA